MKVNARTCWIVLVLTLVTSVAPLRVSAAGDSLGNAERLVRPSMQNVIKDVELMPGGTIAGQVINAAGRPLAGQAIVIGQTGREPIRTRSDQEGRFRVSGLNAGLCVIAYGETAIACRCWTLNTAPPTAGKELLLAPGDSIQRGQRPIADLLTGPILIGMIIGAAIAIPIAIHNSKNDAS